MEESKFLPYEDRRDKVIASINAMRKDIEILRVLKSEVGANSEYGEALKKAIEAMTLLNYVAETKGSKYEDDCVIIYHNDLLDITDLTPLCEGLIERRRFLNDLKTEILLDEEKGE